MRYINELYRLFETDRRVWNTFEVKLPPPATEIANAREPSPKTPEPTILQDSDFKKAKDDLTENLKDTFKLLNGKPAEAKKAEITASIDEHYEELQKEYTTKIEEFGAYETHEHHLPTLRQKTQEFINMVTARINFAQRQLTVEEPKTQQAILEDYLKTKNIEDNIATKITQLLLSEQGLKQQDLTADTAEALQAKLETAITGEKIQQVLKKIAESIPKFEDDAQNTRKTYFEKILKTITVTKDGQSFTLDQYLGPQKTKAALKVLTRKYDVIKGEDNEPIFIADLTTRKIVDETTLKKDLATFCTQNITDDFKKANDEVNKAAEAQAELLDMAVTGGTFKTATDTLGELANRPAVMTAFDSATSYQGAVKKIKTYHENLKKEKENKVKKAYEKKLETLNGDPKGTKENDELYKIINGLSVSTTLSNQPEWNTAVGNTPAKKQENLDTARRKFIMSNYDTYKTVLQKKFAEVEAPATAETTSEASTTEEVTNFINSNFDTLKAQIFPKGKTPEGLEDGVFIKQALGQLTIDELNNLQGGTLDQAGQIKLLDATINSLDEGDNPALKTQLETFKKDLEKSSKSGEKMGLFESIATIMQMWKSLTEAFNSGDYAVLNEVMEDFNKGKNPFKEMKEAQEAYTKAAPEALKEKSVQDIITAYFEPRGDKANEIFGMENTKYRSEIKAPILNAMKTEMGLTSIAEMHKTTGGTTELIGYQGNKKISIEFYETDGKLVADVRDYIQQYDEKGKLSEGVTRVEEPSKKITEADFKKIKEELPKRIIPKATLPVTAQAAPTATPATS